MVQAGSKAKYLSSLNDTAKTIYYHHHLFLSLLEQVVYFQETDYCIILSHYLQLLAEVLQNKCSEDTLHNPQENNCVRVSF